MSTDRAKVNKFLMTINNLKQPAVFDNASNARLQQDAVVNTELKHVTHTLGWLEVPGQVRHQLHIEHPHLIGCRGGHNHLCHVNQLPISQLFGHPVGNVGGVVALIKRSTTQDQCLPLPVRGDII